MPNDEEYLKNVQIPEGSQTPATAGTDPTTPPQPGGDSDAFSLTSGEKTYSFPTNTEFSFKHNEAIQKVPYSKLVNTYRLASSIEQNYNKLKQTHDAQAPEFDKYKGFYDKYGQLQEWSEKNPEDWERLSAIWKNKNEHLLNYKTGLTTPDGHNLAPLIETVSRLEKENEGHRDFQEKYNNDRDALETREDADLVKEEIVTFQKEFPEINLEEADAEGVKVWAKILNYGVQESFPTFESAARMYLKSQLQDTWSSRARNEAVKGIQTENKMGIISKSQTPFTEGHSTEGTNKTKSWEELEEIGRNEYDRLTQQQ